MNDDAFYGLSDLYLVSFSVFDPSSVSLWFLLWFSVSTQESRFWREISLHHDGPGSCNPTLRKGTPLTTCLHHVSTNCLLLSHPTSHHITSHHITSHHITSHHITSHHITSHHITSHHITSRITSHHISHHITYHITYHITSHITFRLHSHRLLQQVDFVEEFRKKRNIQRALSSWNASPSLDPSSATETSDDVSGETNAAATTTTADKEEAFAEEAAQGKGEEAGDAGQHQLETVDEEEAEDDNTSAKDKTGLNM